MREETTTRILYKFDELSDDARDKAVEDFSCTGFNYEWWDRIYEDAATIGLVIEEFDIDCGSSCRGKWTEDVEWVATQITVNHGESCETHKDAVNFLAVIKAGKIAFEAMPDYDPGYEEYDESGGYVEHQKVFQYAILEDYRIMLQKDYEYLTSREAIIETIKANEYEFTEDGTLA